jgi:hypothetical protein
MALANDSGVSDGARGAGGRKLSRTHRGECGVFQASNSLLCGAELFASFAA